MVILLNSSRVIDSKQSNKQMKRARRNHAAGFKAKVAIAAVKDDKIPLN